jgi:hypothetical protein
MINGLENRKVECQILDLQGKSLGKMPYPDSGLDVSEFPSGIYFLKMGDNAKVIRFVKE